MPDVFITGRGGVETQILVDSYEIEAFFKYAGARVRRMRKPLWDALDALTDHVERAFDTEGSSSGHPWLEVSRDWREAKERKGDTATFLLRFNDNLINAAVRHPDVYWADNPGGEGIVYEVDIAYADVHQEGAEFMTPTDGWAIIPPRPFVVIDEVLEATIELIFYDWLQDIHAMLKRPEGRGLNPLL